MGKREPQIILKKDERDSRLELGCEGKFTVKSSGWGEKPVFPEGDKLEVTVKTAAGGSRTCQWARDRRRNWSDAIFRTTETALQRW